MMGDDVRVKTKTLGRVEALLDALKLTTAIKEVDSIRKASIRKLLEEWQTQLRADIGEIVLQEAEQEGDEHG